jgi:hypothetical protein
MKTFFKNLGLFFCSFFLICNVYSQEDFSAEGSNVLRVENEVKLAVPESISAEVWDYLTTKYADENLSAIMFDDLFDSNIDEDLIVDQYYDNLDFQLLAGENGIRHRKRFVIMDTASRKNGRELMQIKINNINSNEQSRGEYKYPVKYYDTHKEKYDNLAFLGLISREYRESVMFLLNKYNIDAKELFPTIIVEQLRKRLYITRRDQPFLTITLDYVTSKYEDKECKFVELELELNEICYTESDSVVKAKMENITNEIKTDVIEKFPSVKQDQTPKYNKSANYIGLDINQIKESRVKWVKITIIIVSVCILIIVTFLILTRKRRKKSRHSIKF